MNKYNIHKQYKEPQIIEKSEQEWQFVTMDFIVKLLESKDPVTGAAYNIIWVVVDRYIKKIYYIPF